MNEPNVVAAPVITEDLDPDYCIVCQAVAPDVEWDMILGDKIGLCKACILEGYHTFKATNKVGDQSQVPATATSTA